MVGVAVPVVVHRNDFHDNGVRGGKGAVEGEGRGVAGMESYSYVREHPSAQEGSRYNTIQYKNEYYYSGINPVEFRGPDTI